MADGSRPQLDAFVEEWWVRTWIAATALVHRAMVWTQDTDFGAPADMDIVGI